MHQCGYIMSSTHVCILSSTSTSYSCDLFIQLYSHEDAALLIDAAAIYTQLSVIHDEDDAFLFEGASLADKLMEVKSAVQTYRTAVGRGFVRQNTNETDLKAGIDWRDQQCAIVNAHYKGLCESE